MKIRRVVTGCDAHGTGVVASDRAAPASHDFASIPGMAQTLVWATEVSAPAGTADPTPAVESFVPAPGGTRFIVLRIPPDGPPGGPVDEERVRGEQLRASPGLAELFEPGSGGMHATPTVDYVTVLSGRLTLDLGDGGELTLAAGDVAVQCGTRHAWRNRGSEPAVAAIVLVGAQQP